MGLVLTRKSGERVMLSNDIVVTVLEGRRAGHVRLDITAPSNIKIWREELTHVSGVGSSSVCCGVDNGDSGLGGMGDSHDRNGDKHLVLAVSMLCLAALNARDSGGYRDALNQIGCLLDARG